MATLDQKIDRFIDDYFPDIDYSILGSNKDKPDQQMGLKYEYFVNSIEYYNFQKNVDSEDIKLISTNDMRGIDGCFFVLNKQFFIVPEWDETDDFFVNWKNDLNSVIKKSSTLELDFYFFQSKSYKTELDKLNGFCDAVYDIFSEDQNDLSNNLKVKNLRYVFDECCKKENKINLILKFCAVSKDARSINQLKARDEWKSVINKNKKELKSNKFESVDIQLKSGQDYQDKLEIILSPNQRDYSIKNLNSKFIEIKNDIANCYIGYLSLFEIKEIIENDDNELDDIFFDNIRYFEGLGDEGSVNSKIYKSLDNNAEIFHTLHNGITITAHSKHFNQATEEFEIKAFSVINGCQTCNIIWLWINDKVKEISDKILSEVAETDNKGIVETRINNETNLFYEKLKKILIPVKIVITSDPKLRANITEAANTQNKVDSIQLIAISEEAKILQSLINENELRQGDKLYYERLTNQFPDIGRSNKITTEDVFRAFYSSFGKVPHKLTVGYGSFEKEKLKNRDFLATNNNGKSKYDINSYYISAVLFNYLERYLRSQYSYLISLRHHILLLLCIVIDKDFETLNPVEKLKVSFINLAKTLIANKTNFNQTVDSICEIVTKKFETFIDNSGERPKVKPKSYYSEEGTTNLIKLFKEEYFK
jgi:hypothetical protein